MAKIVAPTAHAPRSTQFLDYKRANTSSLVRGLSPKTAHLVSRKGTSANLRPPSVTGSSRPPSEAGDSRRLARRSTKPLGATTTRDAKWDEYAGITLTNQPQHFVHIASEPKSNGVNEILSIPLLRIREIIIFRNAAATKNYFLLFLLLLQIWWWFCNIFIKLAFAFGKHA